MRHNVLRDANANIMQEACTDVKIEPILLPINPKSYKSQTNCKKQAKLDISARGLNSPFEKTFYDVRVTHPFCDTNITVELPELYNKNEDENIKLYDERVRNSEKSSFTPLVFSTTEDMGPMCHEMINRLAQRIADKRTERKAHVTNFIRTPLRFSLLRSTLIAIRGEHGKTINSGPYIGHILFNLVPSKREYEGQE